MNHRHLTLTTLASLGFLLGTASGTPAQMIHAETTDGSPVQQTSQFQRLEQPLWVKATVTAAGFGLIGLELWWFLFSHPKTQKARASGGVQEITVTVDGGYEPSQIVVQVGQPVRLNFYRTDPNSCLEEVRLPDFHIARNLPVNQTTRIQFTPQHPGNYEFTCGMNMFRGNIQVTRAPEATASTTDSAMGVA